MFGTVHNSRRRTTGLAAIGVALVALLTGCMKTDVDITLTPDDTANMTIVFAVADEFASQLDMTPEGLWAEMSAGAGFDKTFAKELTKKPFKGDGYTGEQYTATGRHISEFDQPEFSIKRDGNTYIVDGLVDFTDTSTKSLPEELDPAKYYQFSVSLTFPGEVIESNGKVDESGKTVVFTFPYGEKINFHAVGDAGQPSEPEPTLAQKYGPVALTLGVVAIVAVVVIRRGMKKRAEEDRAEYVNHLPYYFRTESSQDLYPGIAAEEDDWDDEPEPDYYPQTRAGGRASSPYVETHRPAAPPRDENPSRPRRAAPPSGDWTPQPPTATPRRAAHRRVDDDWND